MCSAGHSWLSTQRPGGGGGVLPMWWVIHMCRGFDPLFSLWQDRARSFGGIFSHPPLPKRSFGVSKLPILKELDLLGPKFHFSLDLFGSNFQRPAAHPHQFSDWVPPPGLKGYISLIENYHQWILFFHHKVHNHFYDEQGPVVTIHIPGLHWVKCFICNAVLATKCTNTWSLIIVHIIVHVISMIFQITEYLFMPTYFITFFGMTVYVNISSIYPLIQADPSRPTYPLCVPTAWG